MYIPINMATLITVIGVLVALTNIIVEVVKKVTWDKLPTNIVAVIVALSLTLITFFAWAALCSIPLLWYNVVAAVIVGLMVAYAAMFGYDKLKEVLSPDTK